jgi:hypothetical protein
MAFVRLALTSKHFLIATAFVFLIALPGCGRLVNKPKGKVIGKVTYKGEPVPSGTVTFYGPDNDASSAPIGQDGSYQASAVPVGDVAVTVTTPQPGPTPQQAAKNPILVRKNYKGTTEKSVTIPTKYGRPGSSGLRLTVSEGSQPYDIALK